jgi:hypothetical protein
MIRLVAALVLASITASSADAHTKSRANVATETFGSLDDAGPPGSAYSGIEIVWRRQLRTLLADPQQAAPTPAPSARNGRMKLSPPVCC